MIKLPNNYRVAIAEDSHALAELVNMAGEGLPLYLWEQIAEAGQSAWDIGQQRAKRESGSFSYRNAIVREDSGRVVASLIGYSLEKAPEPTDYSDMPPMFVPLQELEDMVPGTWYVNVLASYPECRGKGYGTELLGIAEKLARNEGKSGLSLIVADNNVGARALYERVGYCEQAQRKMVKDNWSNPGENWILLLKSFNKH